MLFNSVHGAALMLGVTLYLGYSILPTMKRLVSMFFANFSLKKESKPEGEDTQSSQSVSDSQPHEAEQQTSAQRTITHRDIAAGIALMAIFVGLCLSVRPTSTEPTNVACPANLELALGAPQVQPVAADAQAQQAAPAGGLQEDTVDSDVVS